MDSRPEMNVTPLIDVLLVLMTILILAVPILTHSTKIALPTTRPSTSPPVIEYVDIDASGVVYWNQTAYEDAAELAAALRRRATNERVVIQIAPERLAPYGRVAEVLAAAQRAGVARLALTPVSER